MQLTEPQGQFELAVTDDFTQLWVNPEGVTDAPAGAKRYLLEVQPEGAIEVTPL